MNGYSICECFEIDIVMPNTATTMPNDARTVGVPGPLCQVGGGLHNVDTLCKVWGCRGRNKGVGGSFSHLHSYNV